MLASVRARTFIPITFLCMAVTTPGEAREQTAQSPPAEGPRTRAEVIADDRAEKVAVLWPERQSPMVNLVDGLVERGLKEGLDSGQGANGFQIVLGGMRAAQGLSVGVGYRRSDLFRDRLGYRGTARGTVRGAYMVDFDLDFQGLRTARTQLEWYTRFEHSPRIAYYGPGTDSPEANRTTFEYDDFSSDFEAAYLPHRALRFGLTGGYFHARTGPGNEGPPIDEAFPPDAIPGFDDHTHYTRLGVFAYLDSRDSQTGPRSGGLYGGRYREYWDVDRRQFAFRQADIDFQHYLPYFNRTRVLALRGAMVLSFPKSANAVPFYLQPTLGGNDDLRGYQAYRFRDYHSLALSAEHRWHTSSILDTALFVDAGKVVPLKRDINVSELTYSGGIGFRVRLGRAVVSRVDLAWSDEGFRFIGTFSDVFMPEW
jgi:hypothetical protein